MKNKTFFDMGYKNTFNQLEWFPFGYWNNKKEKEEKEWPKWLTLPVHYAGSYWRISSNLLELTDGNFGSVLECTHMATIDRRAYFNHSQRPKKIYVNCQKCGGTGEVKFL